MIDRTLLVELWAFARARRKYWLLPLILLFLLIGGVLMFAQSSVLAPFIYTVF
jgi:hypothetical protein